MDYKGVSIKLKQFVDLVSYMEEIHAAGVTMTSKMWHIGSSCYVRVLTEPILQFDLRDHFFPLGENDPQCTKRGCRLKGAAAGKFLSIAVPAIKQLWTEAQGIPPCRTSHRDQDQMDECAHCNPRIKGSQKLPQ